ncbi:MAG: hypothetical protein IJ485_02640 [Lachnospiraceae bacterium]|nr:hypothetical protein [Lachnospiraceae bacterium]
MHGSRKVASISKNGICKIYVKKLMPYNLYLEQAMEDDIDIRVQNLDNFYHWCASRVLTLDRAYAKEILNSIGATQLATDRDRAHIALSYHCLSLMDIYWTKESYERQDFATLNLFQNHLKSAFVDVSLRGKEMTIENSHLIADDLATQGCYPKAWIRREDGFYLMKDGGEEPVEQELLASKICRCFQLNQVKYEEEFYDGQKVSVSKIVTSLEYSIVPMEHFEIYCMNHEIGKMQYILKLDAYSYYMMNIIDYLIGNTDRHWGNWGVLIDNKTNKPVRLYDLMDFNKAFQAYDTIEGAKCLTVSNKMSQKEAAIEAVKEVGLNQIKEIDESWFKDNIQKEMFTNRLNVLNEHM